MIQSNNQTGGGSHAATQLPNQIEQLPLMSYADLRADWRRLFRSEPPTRIGRALLELGIAWKLQEREHGGLSAGTRRQLKELSATLETKGDLAKSRAAKLKPGSRLMREWHGKTHDVLVVDDGFEWHGKRWRSLSAIAREITGVHWSGPRFFGLGKADRAAAPVPITGIGTGDELAVTNA